MLSQVHAQMYGALAFHSSVRPTQSSIHSPITYHIIYLIMCRSIGDFHLTQLFPHIYWWHYNPPRCQRLKSEGRDGHLRPKLPKVEELHGRTKKNTIHLSSPVVFFKYKAPHSPSSLFCKIISKKSTQLNTDSQKQSWQKQAP